MEYKEMRENIEKMANENYEDLIKAIIGFEKGIDDEKVLSEIYKEYIDNDTFTLLSEDFDYMIDEMKELGKIGENANELEEKDDLVNIVGNIVGEVENLERENANGEKFKVSNFSLVSKDDDGNKVYTNCSAYGDKTKEVTNLKQGDFVKIFGQVRTSIDNNGKEHKNVRVLSSKLLKAVKDMDKSNSIDNLKDEIKELKAKIEERELDKYYSDSFEQSAQIGKDINRLKSKLEKAEYKLEKTSKGKEKNSILGAIEKFKKEDKGKENKKSNHNKEQEI
ncbi:DNA-binding protein [Peptoniphilus sp. MSJ-1]|uniref:DNA-binding protein n=1 Tax=Peptoniphilus ovalis TaxID=2841503 RepID=A0ABS6FJ57_9FIRM|nr:DNA-binding protein [Peptoniphilus ovalis]